MTNKTKNIASWTVLVIVVIGALVLMSSNENSNDSQVVGEDNTSAIASASVLAAEHSDFDFGAIKMGDGPVTHEFEVTNNGTDIVQIGKVYTSCACTNAYIIDTSGEKIGKFGMQGHDGLRLSADTEIAPGESITVEATFDPAFHGPSGVGLAERSVYIETNSTESPRLELAFRATVTR